MNRLFLAAAAALALASAAPARACPSCHDCPMRAAADAEMSEKAQAEERGAERRDACACGAEQRGQPCAERCGGCERCGGEAAKPAPGGGERET